MGESSKALSDLILAAFTFLLIWKPPAKNPKTWTAFFAAMTLAAIFGAIFHGVSRFHTHEFWILAATTTMSSAFLFLAACLTVAKPSWKWLSWLWPVFGVVGFLLGALLSSYPFWTISIVSGFCLLAAALVLPQSPSKKARNWIMLGIVTTVAALLSQKFINGTIFHYVQIGANGFFWLGARRA